jgi:hypothetical protein
MKIVTLVEDKNRERILLMFYNYLALSTTKLNLLLGKITKGRNIPAFQDIEGQEQQEAGV